MNWIIGAPQVDIIPNEYAQKALARAKLAAEAAATQPSFGQVVDPSIWVG